MKFLIILSLIVAISAVQQQQQLNQQCGTLLNQQQQQFYPWIVTIAIKDTQKLILRDYFIMVSLTPENERSQIPSLHEMQQNVGTHKQIQQPSFMCSGVLISNNFVLTSAKCVYNISATDLIVNFGLTDLHNVKRGQNELFVNKVIVRKDFNVENVDNNLALLQLSKPIEHSNMVNTICLPQQTTGSQEQLSLGNTKEILGGFGFYEPVKQQQFNQQQQQQQQPNQKFRHSFIRLESVQQGKCEAGGKNTLCAVAFNQQSDVCLGDDGSPVFHELNKKFVLDGVVSFYNSENQQQQKTTGRQMGGQTSQEEQQQSGEQQEQFEQCVPTKTKITITNVKPYLNWINTFIQQNQQQQTQQHTNINTKTQQTVV